MSFNGGALYNQSITDSKQKILESYSKSWQTSMYMRRAPGLLVTLEMQEAGDYGFRRGEHTRCRDWIQNATIDRHRDWPFGRKATRTAAQVQLK